MVCCQRSEKGRKGKEKKVIEMRIDATQAIVIFLSERNRNEKSASWHSLDFWKREKNREKVKE